jgi:hypothetical protein
MFQQSMLQLSFGEEPMNQPTYSKAKHAKEYERCDGLED